MIALRTEVMLFLKGMESDLDVRDHLMSELCCKSHRLWKQNHSDPVSYTIYRATVQIASLHYRPQRSMDDDNARRSISYAIQALAAL